eukprot:COSAG02_NODE_16972_length_1039_cov_1.206383_2_plen_126_part_01
MIVVVRPQTPLAPPTYPVPLVMLVQGLAVVVVCVYVCARMYCVCVTVAACIVLFAGGLWRQWRSPVQLEGRRLHCVSAGKDLPSSIHPRLFSLSGVSRFACVSICRRTTHGRCGRPLASFSPGRWK